MRLTRLKQLTDEDIRAMIDDCLGALLTVSASLSPEHPFIRGTSQNPDVYFQARESVNRYLSRLSTDCPGDDGSLRGDHWSPLSPV